jgi:hypothetical protein
MKFRVTKIFHLMERREVLFVLAIVCFNIFRLEHEDWSQYQSSNSDWKSFEAS